MKNEQPLTATDLQNLACSFITPELASQAGLFRVDSITGADIVGQTKKAGREDFAGVIFPYYLAENLTPIEYRLRRDNPPIEQKTDGTQKETAKYLTPAGRGNLLYFPPNCQKPWLSNINLPIVITEGEKKTLALHRASWHGSSDMAEDPHFLALGLQGVWNFRGQIGKTANAAGKRVPVRGLIPDFNSIEWKKRKVIILFDSNTATDNNVQSARRSLAKDLKTLGAVIHFADLPETAKCNGIDDVLGKIEREQNADAACEYLFELLNKATGDDATAQQTATRFETRNDGVYFIDESNYALKICSPLQVLAETHTTKGENYGRLLEWRDSQNRVHSWAMPIELVHSDSSEHIKYLVSRGLEVIPSRKNREKVSLFLANSKPAETRICTDKTGWHQNLFVLPETTIGTANNSKSQIIFQSASGFEHRFQIKGTSAEWQNNIARLCIGSSRLVFAVSCAFASCLLTPLSENGGGFHFRGASSLGKSTALLVAGSVWGGDDQRGFLDSWRATANGLESIAELHNDSLLCLDELKQCDPKQAAEVAYMLANGQGKGRMNRNILARRSLTWNLLFLSSGELSLSDVVAQTGGRIYGGQEVRMCDIPADAESGLGLFENLHEFTGAELFSKQLQENSRNFYGAAIREFLQKVSVNLENLKTRWINFRQAFMKSVLPLDASGEVQRVASRFALAAFGGWLAREICGWSDDEAIEAAQTVFKAWLDTRSIGNTDTENAISQVRHFLEMHGDSRFQTIDNQVVNSPSGVYVSANSPKTIVNRAGFKRINAATDETEFLILPESFRVDICKGFDFRFVAKELKARGFLICNQDSNQKTERLPEYGVTKVYAVSSRIFEDAVPTNANANAAKTF